MTSTIEQTVTLGVAVQSDHLVELLEGASTHADAKASPYDKLGAVKIVGEGGKITATATDKYRLIEGEIEGEGELDASLIPLADIKRILALVKPNKLPRSVSLSRVGDILTVSVAGDAASITLLEGTYPDTAHLLDYSTPPVALESISFNPKLFADYAKIAGKDKPVRVEFTGDRKPIRVFFTGNKVAWKALLMPMR